MPKISYCIRKFKSCDASMVDELAIKAFERFKTSYCDWSAFKTRISNMSSLSKKATVFVAVNNKLVIGAVAYYKPGTSNSEYFPNDAAIIRMLVVDPDYQACKDS